MTGYVGRAIPGCDLKLSDVGELLTRGPNVFIGYWNRPDATAEMVREGWLHTGDLAELDKHGNLKVLGRVKDVIVPESGHNVAPLPIEQRVVEAGPGIEHAVVVGRATVSDRDRVLAPRMKLRRGCDPLTTKGCRTTSAFAGTPRSRAVHD